MKIKMDNIVRLDNDGLFRVVPNESVKNFYRITGITYSCNGGAENVFIENILGNRRSVNVCHFKKEPETWLEEILDEVNQDVQDWPIWKFTEETRALILRKKNGK